MGKREVEIFFINVKQRYMNRDKQSETEKNRDCERQCEGKKKKNDRHNEPISVRYRKQIMSSLI